LINDKEGSYESKRGGARQANRRRQSRENPHHPGKPGEKKAARGLRIRGRRREKYLRGEKGTPHQGGVQKELTGRWKVEWIRKGWRLERGEGEEEGLLEGEEEATEKHREKKKGGRKERDAEGVKVRQTPLDRALPKTPKKEPTIRGGFMANSI